jgi:hypothetical protein
MQNVTTSIKGSILTITVDLSKDFGRSKSGKSTIIASTGGNISVDPKSPEIKLGLNIYK